MTMVLTNRTTDYDGSPSGENDVQTAAGAVVVTYSGTKSADGITPAMTIYSRSETADYTPIATFSEFGRWKLDLVSADEYYFVVKPLTGTGASVDISAIAA